MFEFLSKDRGAANRKSFVRALKRLSFKPCLELLEERDASLPSRCWTSPWPTWRVMPGSSIKIQESHSMVLPRTAST